MNVGVAVIKKIDITNHKLAKEVFDIQILSYKVEAEIIVPPLKDTFESLQRSGETFFGYYLNEELCGVISFKTAKSVIDIHRLMVHPNHFRKGIAKKLVDFVESNKETFETIIVSTGTKNAPAVDFYFKNGFSKTGEKRVSEYLSLTFFKKEI